MKKKSVKKPKKQARKAPKMVTMLDTLPNNRGEWLEIVIRLTDRAGSKTMQAQAVRLRKELEEWNSANK